MIGGLLAVLVGGCVTDVPEVRPPTSKEMTSNLPDPAAAAEAPGLVPGAVPAPAPGGGPTEMTMHHLRGAPAGTNVTVRGFMAEADGAAPIVSADSEGKTLLLRCDGSAPVSIARETAVEVTGTTAPHDGEVSVLTSCTIRPSSDTPVDVEAGGATVRGG